MVSNTQSVGKIKSVQQQSESLFPYQLSKPAFFAVMQTSDLFDEAYSELRKLAEQLMLAERDDHTLSATALVSEAFLRLGNCRQDSRWQSRSHFLAAAARAMRRVLIDHARGKAAAKRGGSRLTIDVDGIEDSSDADLDFLLDVDNAIASLAEEDPLAAEFARLRLYSGQSIIVAGEVLGLRKTAAYQVWEFIESWFFVYRQQRLERA